MQVNPILVQTIHCLVIGFMKKALHEVLDEDLPRSLRTRNKTSNLVSRQSPVQADGNKSLLEEESPQSTSEGLDQTEVNTEAKTEEAVIDMGNTEMKMFQAAMDDGNSPVSLDKRFNSSLIALIFSLLGFSTL